MTSYSEKLRDPRWQKKRLKILERDGFKCTHCGDTESTLHVHHTYYGRSTNPWDVPDAFLCTVCETCHDAVTYSKNCVNTALGANWKAEELDQLHGIIQSLWLLTEECRGDLMDQIFDLIYENWKAENGERLQPCLQIVVVDEFDGIEHVRVSDDPHDAGTDEVQATPETAR